MDAMAEIRQTFFEECADGLGEFEAGLRAIENGATDYETVNTVFRAVHSIKGGAASFNLDDLSHFAHIFEAVLDELRSNRLEATPDVVALVRRAAERLSHLVAKARDNEIETRRMLDVVEELKVFAGEKGEKIARFWSAGPVPEVEDDGMEGLEFQPVGIDLSDILGSIPESRYRIVFKPMPELYEKANESSRLIRDCLALGSGVVTCDTGELPAFSELQPEGAYLTWTVELSTRADEDSIRGVFEFAEWDCELTIERIEEIEDDTNDAGAASIDAAFASLLMQIQSGSAAGEQFEDEEAVETV